MGDISTIFETVLALLHRVLLMFSFSLKLPCNLWLCFDELPGALGLRRCRRERWELAKSTVFAVKR